MKRIYFFCSLFISIFGTVQAQLVHVPGDYSTIQSAIDGVSDNDTILIAPGTYLENPVIGKPLTLASQFLFSNDTMDIVNTIIDGNQSGSAITVQNIQTDTVRFAGLTVTNGNGTLCDPLGTGIEELHGGGFYIKDAAAVVFDNMLVTENQILTEHNSAGGVFCQNSMLWLRNSRIKDNLIQGGSFFGEGAGLYFFESETFISNCEITGNTSWLNYGKGGGIYANNSTLNIMNSIINNNKNIHGGAMVITDSDLEIHNCSIDNNTAHITGAIEYNDFGSHTFLMTNTTVNENESTNTDGAFSLYQATVEFRNCEINDNTGGYDAGAFDCTGSTINIYHSEINRNVASSGIGGDGAGMSLYNCSVYLNHVEFDENVLSPLNNFCQGAAIEMSSSQLVMDSVIISNNIADEGAAIYSISSTIHMNNVLIYGNDALRGGAIYAYGSDISAVSSTFYGNSAPIGGGVYSNNNHFILVNSILWNNTPSEIYFKYDDPSYTTFVDVAYSDIRGLENNFINSNTAAITWHDGNLDTDPQFINPEENNFTLASSSLLINAGTAYFELDGNVVVDYSPDQYWGTAPDIGSIEYEGLSVGLDENKEPGITVWPNPFTTDINISNTSNRILSFDIVDQSGRVLKSGSLQNSAEHTISTQNLEVGIYFIRLKTENGMEVKKIVKAGR